MPLERVVVPEQAAGERLDRYLADHLGLPRSQLQRWIDEGRVRVGGRPAKAAARLAAGETVEWEAPPPVATDERLVPEAGELVVLYADGALLAIDKPAGLTVHPGAGRRTGTLVHRLLAHYPEVAGVGGPGRPGIVHRLDQGTSGVMVIARTAAAYQRLSRAFAARQVSKRYLAICHGIVRSPRKVDAPIGRHPSRRQEMAVRAGGRPAVSRLRPLATTAGASLVEVELLTGRTHQVRVHLKSLGHPLVGDPLYGEARWKGAKGAARAALRDFPRPALHAWRLGFEHPLEQRRIELEAPPPADLQELWRALADLELVATLATA
ncbi:MAG TPA: RluA family pseudouridine synthase [Thermoanaerobaculia bacterium]|jgi:23S rRNA pseudouridine1911/1915/1917 synthase|nr:RluA family pseudouridine synthase [Thermoanaerobaculia bacterium]